MDVVVGGGVGGSAGVVGEVDKVFLAVYLDLYEGAAGGVAQVVELGEVEMREKSLLT